MPYASTTNLPGFRRPSILRSPGVWAALLLLSVLFPASAAAQPASSRDLKTIIDDGVLKVSLTRFTCRHSIGAPRTHSLDQK